MKTDRERAPIMMRRTKAALVPVSAFDDEMLEQYAEGAVVEVSIKRRRSLPQLRMYWAMLKRVVEATDCHPSAAYLHDAIKLELGYMTPIKRLNGKIEYVLDSTAIAAMDANEFKNYFDRAVELLNRLTGTDVLAEAA